MQSGKALHENEYHYFYRDPHIGLNQIISADPRLSAFITHCGYGSLLESASYATPIIAVPIFGDQMRNAKIAEKHGFGEIFKMHQRFTPIAEFESIIFHFEQLVVINSNAKFIE